MGDVGYIIGQLLGGVAILLGFLSYQMRTQRGLLVMQTVTAVTFCAHYLLIGATTGMVLNVIAILRNAVYFRRTQKNSREMITPILFALIMGAAGILTWEAWYSVLALLGLIINTLCMSFYDPQKVRKSILISSPMVLAYDAFAFSVGGMVYESVAIISACIGIFRNKKHARRSSHDL